VRWRISRRTLRTVNSFRLIDEYPQEGASIWINLEIKIEKNCETLSSGRNEDERGQNEAGVIIWLIFQEGTMFQYLA
jgi:hypothetical protein